MRMITPLVITPLMIIALVISVIAGGGAAMATTLMKMSFVETLRAADGVLIGTVVDINSKKADDGIIYSFVTLTDLEVVRGSYGGERFTLRIEGGEVDGEVQRIEGAPRFREGEKVMIFVEGNGENIVPLVGWTQGLFRIVRAPGDKDKKEFVVDALGNRVFGIRDGEVIKESRFGSEAELVGGTASDLGRSETPQYHLGDVQGGQLLAPEESVAGPMLEFHGAIGEVMTLKAFREQIAVQIQSAGIGAPPGTLMSVEPGRMPSPAPSSDAAPPSLVVDDVAPPLLPSEREDTPRRIKPKPEGADE